MNESDATPGPVEPRAIERRTVLKGAAWATPAIMLMSATPAFAVSPGTGDQLLVSISLAATRHTGNPNDGKTVDFVWSLQANAAVTITSISFSAQDFTIATLGQQSIAAGQTVEISFTGANQSANESTIPAIAITVTLSDNRTATFATVSIDAAQGVSTAITVTAPSSNPTV